MLFQILCQFFGSAGLGFDTQHLPIVADNTNHGSSHAAFKVNERIGYRERQAASIPIGTRKK